MAHSPHHWHLEPISQDGNNCPEGKGVASTGRAANPAANEPGVRDGVAHLSVTLRERAPEAGPARSTSP